MRVLAVSPESGPAGPFPLLLAYTAAVRQRGGSAGILWHPAPAETLRRSVLAADVVLAAEDAILPTAEACREAGRPFVPVLTRPGEADRYGIWAGWVKQAIIAADWLRASNPLPGVDVVTVRAPCPREAAQVPPGDATKATVIDLRDEAGGALFWMLVPRHPDREFLAIRAGETLETAPDLLPTNVEVLPPDADLADVWPRTRVLLIPGAGVIPALPAHEAAWNGIPAIATRSPAALQLLGPAPGHFVEQGDLDGWDEALRTLDDPEEYADASLAALERAEVLEEEERPAEALWGLLAAVVREAGPVVHVGPRAARSRLYAAWLRLPDEYRARRGETARDRDLLLELPGAPEPETEARVVRVPADATSTDLRLLRDERAGARIEIEFTSAMALGTRTFAAGVRATLDRAEALAMVELGKARRVVLSAQGD